MSELAGMENPYREPRQHPIFILGGLQLVAWIFFRPSAWRAHVTRIDSSLRPDFTVLGLTREQWRNPAVRRLLAQCYLLWPLLSAVLQTAFLAGTTGLGGALLAIVLVMGVSFLGPLGFALPVHASGVFTVCSLGLVRYLLTGGNWVSLGVFFFALGISAQVVARIPGEQAPLPLQSRIIGFLLASVGSIMAVNGLHDLSRLSSMLFTWLWKNERLATTLVNLILYPGIGMAAVSLQTKSPRRVLMAGCVISAACLIGSMSSQETASWGFLLLFSFIGAVLVGIFSFCYSVAATVLGPRYGGLAGSVGMGTALFLLTVSIASIAKRPLSLSGDVPRLFFYGLLGLTFSWWRPMVLLPLQSLGNAILHHVERRKPGLRLLHWHSAFRDEFQWNQLSGLDRYLVLVAEREPSDGRAAISALSTGPQRWAALAAQLELDARQLERCDDVRKIAQAHWAFPPNELADAANAPLRSLCGISKDVEAALQQGTPYSQRLVLSSAADRLDQLVLELNRSQAASAIRLRSVANHWVQTVRHAERELAQQVEARQELENPYIIGVPLTERQEIFVGRGDVSARVEKLLLDPRSPPLLLYGQRRMGKTSLLNNLGRLLPSQVVPMFVDLQGPATQASDHAGLLYNLSRAMVSGASKQRELLLRPLTREELKDDPFTRFDEWLDSVEQALGDRTALLALDEFEALDKALSEGRFLDSNVLGMLRNLIQHRRRFKVLVAGSRTLDELQRWASYLINVQVIHLTRLQESEARHLIERPVKDFPLRYEPEAVQRVLQLTRGHPFLLQLLCSEIVSLKNEQDVSMRRLASVGDVEAAITPALEDGVFFFSDLKQSQVDAPGLGVLLFLAARGEGAVVGQDELLRASEGASPRTLEMLQRRELLEQEGGGYRFQVELVRRWFAQPTS